MDLGEHRTMKDQTKGRAQGKAAGRAMGAIVGMAVLLTAIVIWTMNTWPALTMDQLVYHIQANMQGTSPSLVINVI